MTSHFRVEGTLGVGPDGPVLLAVPERLGGRPVALRRVEVHGDDVDRVRRDCETLAGLGHPGLAVVEDLVEQPDGSVLLATPVAGGGTLAQRLVHGPLPLEEAIDVAATVADALAAAHRAGLTHRRLHAGNVLLGDDGPLVTDLAQGPVARPSRTPDPVADDVHDVARLALGLVDRADGSAAAADYRAACSALAEDPSLGLDDFLARLRRIGTGDDEPGPAVARPQATDEPAAPPARGTVVVLAVSTAIGVLLGAAGTLLPAVP